jgi:hypothetical protein
MKIMQNFKQLKILKLFLLKTLIGINGVCRKPGMKWNGMEWNIEYLILTLKIQKVFEF